MLGIRKGPEPQDLKVYREKTPKATYKGFQETKSVRDQLYADQGGLCAYCMRKVQYDPSMSKGDREQILDFTIEHWSPQSTTDRGLHWPDMLGVCNGRLVVQGELEYICDKARGNLVLTVHPARDHATIEGLCSYLRDGTLCLHGKAEDEQTLNLNAKNLRASRKIVADVIAQKTMKADITALQQQLQRWEGRDSEGCRLEYAGVALYLLRKAIRQRESKGNRIRKTSKKQS